MPRGPKVEKGPSTRSVLPSWSQGTEAASWAGSQGRLGCLAMPSYVARPHVLADEFVPGYLGDSFGLLPFVHGHPLANQFDSPFLVRLIRKEVTHTSGFPFGIKTRDPDIPSCRHSGTMRRSCCWSIPCHNQAGPLPGKDTPVSDIPQRFQWPAIRECCAMGGRSRRSLESGRRDRLWAPLIFPWRPRQ